MSRDANGNYSLPGGNPVITGTTISSSWANTTLNDIASAMTDSLSRSGLGGMTAGLKLAAGTSALPGLAWALETNSGLYRAGAGDFRWVIGGNELFALSSGVIETEDATLVRVTSSGDTDISPSMEIASALPQFNLRETDAAADNRIWAFYVSGEALVFSVVNDAGSLTVPWMTVNRTGAVVDSINFSTNSLQYGGIEVGYRTLPQGTTLSGSAAASVTDSGKMVTYTGAGGHQYTLGNIATNVLIMVNNSGTGVLTLAASGTLSWLNGSGVISTGGRLVTVGGIVSCWHTGSGNWTVWGTGLS